MFSATSLVPSENLRDPTKKAAYDHISIVARVDANNQIQLRLTTTKDTKSTKESKNETLHAIFVLFVSFVVTIYRRESL